MKSFTLRPDTVTHTELQCYSFRYDSAFVCRKGKKFVKHEALVLDAAVLNAVVDSISHRNWKALSVSTEEKDDAGKMISIQRKLVEIARRVPKEKEEFMNQLMLESVHSCLGITIPNSG